MERGVPATSWVSCCRAMNADNPRPSRIRNLALPPLPPLSPPPTSTVFPDEPAVEASVEPSVPLPPLSPVKPAALTVEPETVVAGPSQPSPPVTPLPTPPPEPTAITSDILPRHRPFSGFSPPPKHAVPEWIPLDNYHPASGPVSPADMSMMLESEYTSSLPALPPLPVRPVDKRRRANKPEERRKDLAQLSLEYSINPLSGNLSKSSKCLMTEDWRIAATELRHVRVMEKIEAKKESGRWSLRQPKKLRGPSVPKSHWDYLLEEMEWMRTDFAEERRWKFVEAREFAYQCVEWHLASEEEKAEMMVGNRGWGSRKDARISDRMASDRATADTMDIDPSATTAEDDVEMLIQPDADDLESEAPAAADHAQATGAEVLEEIMPDSTEPKEEPGVDTDAAETTIADAERDADGEADAEGEVDAEGEADADGEVEEDVIGLDGA